MMNLQATTDIWFTAFLCLKGIEIEKHEVIKRGKGRYYFKLESDRWRELKLEFTKSEACKFKEVIGRIKDLTY